MVFPEDKENKPIYNNAYLILDSKGYAHWNHWWKWYEDVYLKMDFDQQLKEDFDRPDLINARVGIFVPLAPTYPVFYFEFSDSEEKLKLFDKVDIETDRRNLGPYIKRILLI